MNGILAVAVPADDVGPFCGDLLHLVGAALAAFCLAHFATAQEAQPARIAVGVDQPGSKIPPTLWGIFFEDINLSADGGIYPEQVRNRNFEDSDKPAHWTTVGSDSAKIELSVDTSQSVSPKNPRSLQVAIAEPGNGRAGVANGGFYGMGVVKGAEYVLSFDARGDGSFAGPLTVTLESTDGVVYAHEKFSNLAPDWRHVRRPRL